MGRGPEPPPVLVTSEESVPLHHAEAVVKAQWPYLP